MRRDMVMSMGIKVLLAIMEERGLTPSKLARRLHVSPQNIRQQLARDRVRPSTARAIAGALGVGLSRIATLEGEWLREEESAPSPGFVSQ